VVNAPPLGAVLDDPRVRTGALSVREAGHQVHLGVLRVDGADRRIAAELAAELPADSRDLLLDLTRALTAAGVPVQPIPLGGYGWARTAVGSDGAESAIAGLDERTVRLREAARGGDGFYSTFVLRRLSWRLTGLAERTGLTPNQVTLISFALGLVAAGCLAVGSRPWSIAGALLLQVCLVVDCVDGELARYRRRFSRFGAWLDATTDRVKEFAAIAALAAGAAIGNHQDLWWLVAAALAVQTFRNLFDLGWAMQRSAAGPAPQPAIEWVAAPSALPPGARPAGPGAASWLRRIGHFPIGERFLLISLGAALWTPRGTLTALLIAGLLSAGYMIVAFAVRSSASAASGRGVAALADAGPLLGAAIRQVGGDRAGRLTVVLPALTGLTELALIWLLAHGVAGARGSAAVVLIAATAIAHYQQAYGIRDGGADPGAPASWVIGTDLRLLVLLVAVVLPALVLPAADGDHWATVAAWVLAALITGSSTLRSLRSWTDPDHGSKQAEQTGDIAGGSQPTVLRQAIGGVR
jgi:phosphatidylglycerophosphate synthase